MKSLLAVFLVLLLSACQSVSTTQANAAQNNASEAIVSENVSDNSGFITNVSLKQAVDVEQIDSLMQLEKVGEEVAVVEKPKVIATKLDEAPVSLDPITLSLLERGETALAQQKLLTPEEDNANLYFQAALGREPDNLAAQTGIKEIVRYYTAWALDKAKQGQTRNANKYLAAASFVDEANPLIKQTKQEIKDWRAGIKRTSKTTKNDQKQSKSLQTKFYLPQNLFSLPEALVIQKLQPIIDRIEKDQLNIEIFWPNDKEARLLYRIINSRTEDFRVRGMIYCRAQHMIEVKQG
ncbi:MULTISPECIES: hypothetical protein [unclassified Marinomonas]|uniref:hypothetical protein n=1 Tax=unclassified Marinomonas TaxID=196814 RepID=UPI0007AEF9A6|nr:MULTISPECIES: hypothetical protein [unclassified Marinomonas]